MKTFPLVEIVGDARQRGVQHGESLRGPIRDTIEFYQEIFDMPERVVFEHSRTFAGLIQSFSRDYAVEIESIARGADCDALWIYALNSRTEILSQIHRSPTNECTALYFSEPCLLGQNWDWGRALEPLTVVMKLTRPDQHSITMITEPGIIGKIGMNNSGVGVCLNILSAGAPLEGLPVHVLLRAVLDCQSFAAAENVIRSNAGGKSSNILLADADGHSVDFELCDEQFFCLTESNGVLLHTNHYLAEPRDSRDKPDFFSSYARFDKAKELLVHKHTRDTETMKQILSDDSNTELPIYRDYVPESMVKEVGTVCTVVMDLRAKQFHVRRGKYADAAFVSYGVTG
ncbi:MAG: C45 family peptidase [Pseudomonadota bacterium]